VGKIAARYMIPDTVQARAILNEEENKLDGDAAAWGDVPLLYVEYLRFEPWRDFVLLKVSPQSGRIQVQRLEWYDDTYDKGYQGVIGVLELPGEEFAVVSVQRSSQLIFHDLNTGLKRGTLNLGGCGGNRHLEFRKGGKEIWANDDDTVVVIRRSDWQVLRSARLQGTNPQVREFIGDFSYARRHADSGLPRRCISGVHVALQGNLRWTVGFSSTRLRGLPGRSSICRWTCPP